jgi:hypothetical protein
LAIRGSTIVCAVQLALPLYAIGFVVALGGAAGLIGNILGGVGVFLLGLAIFSAGLYVEEKSLH